MAFTFGQLRRKFAPGIRSLFERCRPLRVIAVRLLSWRQKGRLTRCGMSFVLPSGDFGVTLEAESTGSYEPVTTNLIESLLSSGMTFIDIGAHVGLFAIPATQWVGRSGKVIAFEPHPKNFDLLLNNLKINQVEEEVTAIQSAISNKTQSMDLYTCSFNTGDHQLYPSSTRDKISVPCTTLDDFFPSGTQVDLVKMDVQGAEGFAFEGMRRLLEENKAIQIIWELSPQQLLNSGYSASKVLDYLDSLDFSSTLIDDVTGEVIPVSREELLTRCPKDSYINILSSRHG